MDYSKLCTEIHRIQNLFFLKNLDLATFDSIGNVTNNNTLIQSGTGDTVDVDALETFLGFTLNADTTYSSFWHWDLEKI
jgi:hypothetical protein